MNPPHPRDEAAEAERDRLRAEVAALRKLRPEVLAFAQTMEEQLRANDHKPGWKNDPPIDLIARLREEVEELDKTHTTEHICRHCRTCHYEWVEACLDAAAREAGKEGT